MSNNANSMAASNSGRSTPSFTAVSTPSKMDKYSRDELIVLLKKQVDLLKQTKQKCENVTKENQILIGKVPPKDEQIDGLQAQLIKIQNDNLKLVAERQDLEMQLKEAESNAVESVEGMTDKNNALLSQVNQLQLNLSETKANLDEQHEIVQLKADVVIELQNKLQLLEANEIKLATEWQCDKSSLIAMHEAELKRVTGVCQEKLMEADEKHFEMETIISELKEAVESKQIEMQSTAESQESKLENHGILVELEDVRGRLVDAEEEIANLAEENAKFNREKESKEVTNGSADMFASKDREILNLREQIRTKQIELSALADDNSDIRSELTKFREQLEAKESEFFSLQEDLAARAADLGGIISPELSTEVTGILRKDSQAKAEEISDLKMQISALKINVQDKLNVISKWEQNYASLELGRDSDKMELGNVRRQLTAKSAVVLSLRNELDEADDLLEEQRSLSQAGHVSGDHEMIDATVGTSPVREIDVRQDFDLPEVNDIQQQECDTKVELVRLENDLASALVLIEQLQQPKDCDNCKGSNEMMQNLEQSCTSLKDELNTAYVNESTLKQKNNEMTIEVEELLQKITLLETQQNETLAKLNYEIEMLKSELKCKTDQMINLREENDKYLDVKQVDCGHCVDLQEKIDVENEKLRIITEKHESSTMEMTNRMSQLSQLHELEAEKFESRIAELVESLRNTKVTLEEKQIEMTNINILLENNKLQLSEKDIQFEKLKDENDDLIKMSTVQKNADLSTADDEKPCEYCAELTLKLSELDTHNSSRIAQLEMTLADVNVEKADAAEKADNLTGELEKLRNDFFKENSLYRESESARVKTDNVVSKLKTEMQNMYKQLSDERASSNEVREKLRKVQNELEHQDDAKQGKEILSLEFNDLERSLKRLESQLADRDKEIARQQELLVSKSNESASLQKEIVSIQSQKSKSDETCKKLKTLIVKQKKEMSEQQQSIDKKQNELEQVLGKLRLAHDELDCVKVDQSSIIGESQQLIDRLQSSTNKRERQNRDLESEKSKLELDLQESIAQVDNLRMEFDTYKAKVQSVLKQQRRSAEEDAWTMERQHLTKAIENGQEKLRDTSELLNSTREDLGTLQENHDRLMQRFRELQIFSESKEKTLRQQLEVLTAESSLQASKYAETVRQLTQSNEKLKQDFNDRIEQLQQEHTGTVDALQERIEQLESTGYHQSSHAPSVPQEGRIETASYETKNGKSTASMDIVNTSTMAPLVINSPTSSDELMEIDAKKNLERKQLGISSGYTTDDDMWTQDTPKATSPTTMQGFMPLDELIANDSISVASAPLTPSFDQMANLESKLTKSHRRIEHLNEVLNESEANNARLADQAGVLKEEIRRMQRNEEREKHFEQLEYLKNIFLQFLHLKVGDERERLVPVLTTMLKLSNDETRRVLCIAKGEDGSALAASSSWSNYLHRWSGFS